jgi:hypothetical protein
MAQTDEVAGAAEEPAVVSAVRTGGADALSSLTERYVRAWGEQEFRATTLDVLRIENGRLIEITTIDARTFPAFGLPLTWTGPELTQ